MRLLKSFPADCCFGASWSLFFVTAVVLLLRLICLAANDVFRLHGNDITQLAPLFSHYMEVAHCLSLDYCTRFMDGAAEKNSILHTWNKDIYSSLVLFHFAVHVTFSAFIGAHVIAGVFHCCVVNEERRRVVAGQNEGVFLQGLGPGDTSFTRTTDVEHRVGLEDELLFVRHDCRWWQPRDS